FLGAGALLFALQNTAIVPLTFLGWQFESSLALVVILSITFGVLMSILASIPSALSASFKIMGLKKQNTKLAEEVIAHKEALAASEAPVVVDLRD
ncbi:LapA family protein, partial [Patescibacteria group bacterium]|nr:LapA family protein [Patescibacteria group bacterium]MBU1754906.1 LapA family protein [Patescibacteria group bacterium]